MANEIKIEILAAAWQKAGLKMTSRRYRQLAGEGKAPIPANGIVDALRALISIAIYYQALAAGSGSLSLTDEKTRLTKINADMKQINLLERMGKLVSADAVKRVYDAHNSKIAKKFGSLPTLSVRLGHQDPVYIMGILEEYERECRAELSTLDVSRIAYGAVKKRNARTKSKTVGKRVGRGKKNSRTK